MKKPVKILTSTLLTLAASLTLAWADDKTALELAKEANDYVGIQCKDQVLQIRCDKSVAGLEPQVWYVTFYDEDATFKAAEVKFEAGKKKNVKRPARVDTWATADSKFMDMKKITVDSDEAVKTAKKEKLLENLKLSNVQLSLQDSKDDGPLWKVKFWAEKVRKPEVTVDVGEVYVSAYDGKVVKSSLKPEKVE